MKSKGARLTTEISLPGRFLVYVPNGEGSGVSRRLEDDERDAPQGDRQEPRPEGRRHHRPHRRRRRVGRGHRARPRLPAAPLEDDPDAGEGATAPTLVYEEAELPLRIVRDLFAGDFVGAQIDDDTTHRRIVSYLKKTSPHMVERVHRYREKAPLFEASGVDAEIRSTLDRRVDLPSGGYLSSTTPRRSRSSTSTRDGSSARAARRPGPARGHDREEQPRGGEGGRPPAPPARHRRDHRHRLHRHGEPEEPRRPSRRRCGSELERDRTKTYVVEISPLGLVEMTRQNVTDGPREILDPLPGLRR